MPLARGERLALPLTLAYAYELVLISRVLGIICIALTPAFAQVAFDVASVRLTQHGRNADGWSRSSVDAPRPGTFVAVNASLDELIRWAYDIQSYQLSGPHWLNSDEASYDITAKTSVSASKPQIRAMLQALLAERFHLATHHETRSMPIYTLLVSPNGPRLTKAPEDIPVGSVTTGGGQLSAPRIGMAGFARALSREIGRPVFDETGLEGTFAITMTYAPLNVENPSDRPSIFAVLERELGLKLQASKRPIQVLVVDRAARIPTEN